MEIDSYKKKFGKEAANYTKYRLPYPQELYDLLFSLSPKSSENILDIACGTGKSTEPLVQSGLKVYGCDHDELMIEEANKQSRINKLNIEYIVADVENLPYEDNSFDVITIGTAFHFFINEKSMTEIKRVLKPKGLFFVYWTLTVKDIPEEDDIPSTIFRSHNWIKVPSELRDIESVCASLKKFDLEHVSSDRIPFTYKTTVDERVGLLTTSGMYELLEDKEKFLSEVKSELEEKLGNRECFTLEEEIQICYGFKS